MSRTQPFRTTRPTGSPSAGGSTHTLAAHMASNSPHPQYVRKGDAVGESNLTGHENDVNAHVTHYVRRKEVAFDLTQFLASYGERYDGDHFSIDKIGTRTLVSTYLINQLFNTDAGLEKLPKVSVREDIVIDFVGHTGVTDNDYRVPRFALFDALASYTKALYSGAKWKLDKNHPWYDANDNTPAFRNANPLSAVFAMIDHTHQGTYLSWNDVKGASSILRFEDIHDEFDPSIIAARSDHKHPEYITEEDLEKIGITFNPDVLRKVGIWEKAVGSENKDLNEFTTQGNYIFKVSKNGITESGVDFISDFHFPEKYIKAIIGFPGNNAGYVDAYNTEEEIKASDSIETAATLNITSTFHSLISFGETDYTPMITDFSKSFTYHVISQRLHTNAPIKYLSDTDVKGDASLLRDYKDDICSSYTRTGYSLESAWYIASVCARIGKTVGEFFTSVSTANPIATISRMFYEAVNALLSKESPDAGDNVIAGFYQHPYAIEDTSALEGLEKLRYCPKLHLVNKKDDGTLDITDIKTSDAFDDPDSALHRIVFNRYSGTRDISRWIMPGCLNKTNGKAITDSIPAAMSRLTALAKPNNKTYIPYMEYFESTALWTPTLVRNPGIGLTAEISESSVYYDGGTYTPLNMEAPTSGIDCPYVSMDDSAESVPGCYVGSPDLGFIAAELIGGSAKSLSPVLLEFRKVKDGDVFIRGNIYATLNSEADPNTYAYTFTRDTSVDAGSFPSRKASLYVATKVVKTGFVPTEEYTGKTWGKRMVTAEDTWFGDGHYYYRYNLVKHEFEDITDAIQNILGGIGSGKFSDLFANYPSFRHPIFEDLSVVTLNTTIKQIEAVPGQYTVPIAEGFALAGVEYVKIDETLDTTITSAQASYQAEAHTTGFNYEGETRQQVAYLILDNPADKVIVGGEEFVNPKVLTKKVRVLVESPVKVTVDETFLPSNYQYLRVNSEGVVPYSRTTFSSEEEFRAAIETGVYRITADKEGVVDYLFVGESLGTGAYGIKLPRYLSCLDKKIGEDHPVYTSALFFKTVDTVAIAGKKYFSQNTSSGKSNVFVKSGVEAGDSVVGLYEVLDLDKYFDVWCAIKQLTTEGSEHNADFPNKLVYNFSSAGELVAWDEWNQTLTNRDIDVKKVEDLKNLDINLISRFSMVDYGGVQRLAFDGNILPLGDSTHGHTNHAILESFGMVVEDDDIDIEDGDELHRLTFFGHRIAYVEELAEMAELMEKAAPILRQITRLTFDIAGHLLVDGNQVAWHSEVEALRNEPVFKEQDEIVRWRHYHANNVEGHRVLDGLDMNASGDLTFNGNVVAAQATQYEVDIAREVNLDGLLANNIWSISLDNLNTLLGKIAFSRIEDLQKCTFQFKLIATTGRKTYMEKDPIATFEDNDDSHLSAGFEDDTLRVALPTVDYFTSFDGVKKGSLSEWAYGKDASFSLVMVISRPGTLGTGDGQYFTNFNVLTRFTVDEEDNTKLMFGGNRVLFSGELESVIGDLGYTKREDFDNKLAFTPVPETWDTLITALKLDSTTGKVSLGNKVFVYESDLSAILKTIQVDSDGHVSAMTSAADPTSRKKFAWLGDLEDFMTESDCDTRYMPLTPVVIEFSGSKLEDGDIQNSGGSINFHWMKADGVTASIIENEKGKLSFAAKVSISGESTFGSNVTISGNTTLSGNLVMSSGKSLTIGEKTLSDDKTAMLLAHTIEYIEVDQRKVKIPDPDTMYYTFNPGVQHIPANEQKAGGTGHPAAWDPSVTYYTKTARVTVDGLQISGVGGSGGSASEVITHDYIVNTNAVVNREGYWPVGGEDDDPIEDKTLCNYEVLMVVNGTTFQCPMANISTDEFNPIYVPAKSLLTCARGYLEMKQPTSWLKIHDEMSGDYTLIVRATPIVKDDE